MTAATTAVFMSSDTPQPPLLLSLTDRSRIEDRRSVCSRKFYLTYAAGASSYGWAPKAQSIPLATGTAYHLVVQRIAEYLLQHDRLPPDELVDVALREAATAYRAKVEAGGWLNVEQEGVEVVRQLLDEQIALLTGVSWAWVLEILPWFHEEFKVVAAEQEDIAVISCTCGLGDDFGLVEHHRLRGCTGIGLMCRPDMLAERRTTGALTYHEIKGTSQAGERFETQWEVMAQIRAATLASERRLARPVEEVWIHGLIKGSRRHEKDYQTGDYSGPIRQSSVFCYGYRRPPNPPFNDEDWLPQYEWFDAEGSRHRASKQHRKSAVWLNPAWGQDTVARASYWAKWIPAEVRRKQLIMIGPLNRNPRMTESFLRELSAEERDVAEKLWRVYDVLEANRFDWSASAVQVILDETFPRSYACRRYGLSHRCAYEPLCFYHEGWQDPVGSGRYVQRRPHHQPELDQAIARGVLVPEEGAEEAPEEE